MSECTALEGRKYSIQFYTVLKNVVLLLTLHSVFSKHFHLLLILFDSSLLVS